MTPPRFVALPRQYANGSRFAWRVMKAIVARDQGWFLGSLHVSRRWRFQVAGSRWIARAYVSFFFGDPGLGQGVVYAINFEGKGSPRELPESAHVQHLRRHLDSYRWGRLGDTELVRVLRGESRPKPLLAELDHIAQAFGSDDRHRNPSTRSQVAGKRLAAIGDSILSHGTWTLQSSSVVLNNRNVRFGTISAGVADERGQPQLATHIFLHNGKTLNAELGAQATSRGYHDQAGDGQADLALAKLQSLSVRAALAEARFIEQMAL